MWTHKWAHSELIWGQVRLLPIPRSVHGFTPRPSQGFPTELNHEFQRVCGGTEIDSEGPFGGSSD